MTNDWIEFTESGYQERKTSPRVMLTKEKTVRINPKAMLMLGGPTAVKFFYDTARSRIGIKAESDQAKNAFPIRRRGKDSCGYVHGSLFCNRFGIKIESTLEFDGVRLDGSGILILELSTATRYVGRASST